MLTLLSTLLNLVLEPASFGPTEQVVLRENVSHCTIINLMFLYQSFYALLMVQMIKNDGYPLGRVYWHTMLAPFPLIAKYTLAIVSDAMLLSASLID